MIARPLADLTSAASRWQCGTARPPGPPAAEEGPGGTERVWIFTKLIEEGTGPPNCLSVRPHESTSDEIT
eukprot:scaffold1529_cov404-Prasinococcus_capsulatus_cf.AAC.8